MGSKEDHAVDCTMGTARSLRPHHATAKRNGDVRLIIEIHRQFQHDHDCLFNASFAICATGIQPYLSKSVPMSETNFVAGNSLALSLHTFLPALHFAKTKNSNF